MNLMRNTLATAAVLGALAAAPYAHAADPCKLEISGNDLMQYDKSELSAPAMMRSKSGVGTRRPIQSKLISLGSTVQILRA